MGKGVWFPLPGLGVSDRDRPLRNTRCGLAQSNTVKRQERDALYQKIHRRVEPDDSMTRARCICEMRAAHDHKNISKEQREPTVDSIA